jgi:hypothetical protein
MYEREISIDVKGITGRRMGHLVFLHESVALWQKFPRVGG